MPGDKAEHPRATPLIIKLNNNDLTDITNLDAAIEKIADISKVITLDLSFNSIFTLEGAFNSFPALRRLYLHSNQISRLDTVLHIQTDCPEVRARQTHPTPLLQLLHTLFHSFSIQISNLTLHGTPLRERRTYRAHVLSLLPHLKSLDFSTTTPSEFRGALQWRRDVEAQKKLRLPRTA